MEKSINGVYLIKNNVTRLVRIGSAEGVAKRFSNYKARLRNSKGNKLMVRDFVNYGEQSFEWILLEECSVEDLYIREKYYLELYSDVAMYNSNAIVKLEKKIRKGLEAKMHMEKRSEVTRGEANGHCTKLSDELVFDLLDMLEEGVSRDVIAGKFDIQKSYISRIGKDRWVFTYEKWINEKGTLSMGILTAPCV